MGPATDVALANNVNGSGNGKHNGKSVDMSGDQVHPELDAENLSPSGKALMQASFDEQHLKHKVHGPTCELDEGNPSKQKQPKAKVAAQ